MLHLKTAGFSLVESKKDPELAVYRKVVKAGEPWMGKISQGQTFRILDLEGNQAADTLFFMAADFSERYDAVRTLQAQGSLYLTSGTVLRSNKGRAMLTIVADTCGRHDTVGGSCSAESNSVRYPREKKHMHNCRDSFLRALRDSGQPELGKRDLPPNINFFMNVPVTPEGGLSFEDGVSAPGKYVEMRADEDVFALISNCPQLNNPCNAYNPTPIEVLIWE